MQQTGIFKHQRLVGLDAWRAVLLVLGVALHAVSNPLGWEQWVGVATHKFRMEAFFAISGLLAAFTLRQQGASKWLARRWISLGVPTLMVMMSLNPLTLALQVWDQQRQLGQELTPFAFHTPILHLWFLPVLLACSTLLASMTAWPALITRMDRAVGHLVSSATPLRRRCLIAAIMLLALAGIGLEQVYTLITAGYEPAGRMAGLAFRDFGLTGPWIPYYFVFYLLGWLIGARPDVAELCLHHRRVLVALVAIGVVGIVAAFWYKGRAYVFPYAFENALGGGRTFASITKALIGVPATLLILSHAVGVRRVPALLDRLSRSSYTIYLVHLFLLTALSAALGNRGRETMPRYLLLVLVTVAVGHQVHFLLVKRSAVLGFLLNGTGRLRDIVPLPVAQWKSGRPDRGNG